MVRMDESQSSGSTTGLPPFVSKTYEMVDDPSTDATVTWSPGKKSFVVLNPLEFSRDLLPKYFKHNNFSSFIRQLNTYGFKKIDPEEWKFANDNFVGDQPHLLKNIHRRRATQNQPMQAQGHAAPLADSERQSLVDTIEKLKQEKDSLSSELRRHEEEKQEYELELQLLNERVQYLLEKHQSLVSLLAQVLKEPNNIRNLMPQFAKNDKKRRLPVASFFDDEACGEEDQSKNLQALSQENSYGATSVPSPNTRLLDLLESTQTFSENNVQRITESQLHNSTGGSQESFSYEGNQDVSFLQQIFDACPDSPGIDVNPEPPASGDPAVKTAAPAATGSNYSFWAQFLTEFPGSSKLSEAQTSDGCGSGSTPGDQNMFCTNWENLSNVA